MWLCSGTKEGNSNASGSRCAGEEGVRVYHLFYHINLNLQLLQLVPRVQLWDES